MDGATLAARTGELVEAVEGVGEAADEKHPSKLPSNIRRAGRASKTEDGAPAEKCKSRSPHPKTVQG